VARADAATTLADAHDALAAARAAAAHGAAPDLEGRRKELLAGIDGLQPRLQAIAAARAGVPTPAGEASQAAHDALLAADPSPAIAALRDSLLDAKHHAELLHAGQQLRDLTGRLDRAEEELPALVRDARLAAVLDEVVSLWSVCDEVKELEGGAAPLRAADRALRTARAARARDDEGALARAHRAAHDAAERARAVVAAEEERQRQADDSAVLEELTESARGLAEQARQLLAQIASRSPADAERARAAAERVEEEALKGTLTLDPDEARQAHERATTAFDALRRIADAQPQTTPTAVPPSEAPDDDFQFDEPALRRHVEYNADDTDEFRFAFDDESPDEEAEEEPVFDDEEVDRTLLMQPVPLWNDEDATLQMSTLPRDDGDDAVVIVDDSGIPLDTDEAPIVVEEEVWSPFDVDAGDEALFADHGRPEPADDASPPVAHAIDVIDVAPDLLGDDPDTDVYDGEVVSVAAQAASVSPDETAVGLAALPGDLFDDDDDDSDEEAHTIQMQMPSDPEAFARGEPRAADPQATVIFQRPPPEPPSAVLVDDDDDDELATDAGEDEPTRRLSVASLRERLLKRKQKQEARKRTPPPPPDYDPHAQTMLLTPDALKAMVAAADDDDDDDEDDEEIEAKTTLFYRPGVDD
jgi:hypothetical protein